MDYSGPQTVDLLEVQTLNLAMLELLRCEQRGASLRQSLSPRLQPLVAALTDLHIRRLAQSPFLLLSLRERDDAYWQGLLADDPNHDLFATGGSAAHECQRVQSAATGFLWQLARRNSYAARLVCGATLTWCEQLAGFSLFELLRRTGDCDDLLQLRLAGNDYFWVRLLGAGLSSDASIRRAAQVCALQTTLADGVAVESRRLSKAACRAPVPTVTVSGSVDRF